MSSFMVVESGTAALRLLSTASVLSSAWESKTS